jgi:hypothetical protein
MTVGAQATQAQVDSFLSATALELRNMATKILQQQAFLNKLGITGLGVAGYTAADAQTVLDNVNHMATVMGVYKGTVQQGGTGGTGATLFNFEDYLTPLWAGQ